MNDVSHSVAPRPDPATLQVVNYPAPILKKVAKDVSQFDPWLRAVIARMKTLMVEHKGVGLAAPQVGLGIRLFVWAPSGELPEAKAFINPELSGERGQAEAEEGCLSLPDIRAKIIRYKAVKVSALDEFGKPFEMDLEEFPARVAQHENDHLDGVLIIDKMSPVAKLKHRFKIAELEAAGKKKG
jgi:peptide deformylase